MFRNLKEYQEIAKIYAEKVSKPENLDENRNQMAMKLRQQREANKPQKDSTGKPIPSTAQIRAKDAAAGGTGMSNIPNSGSGGGMEASAFSDKDSSSTPQAKPKMGSPDSKFIKRSKGPGFVKRGTPGAQRAENIEKNRNRAKEMAKARIAAKKAAMANEEFTPYDIVLEYLLSTEQVATIEEANYVMTEMDGKTINDIVEMEVNRADIIGGTKAAKDAAAGKGKGLYTPGKGVTKDFKLDPAFKLPKA